MLDHIHGTSASNNITFLTNKTPMDELDITDKWVFGVSTQCLTWWCGCMMYSFYI